MYYYYQDGEESPWKVAHSKNGLLEELASQGAKKCTVLAVSEMVDSDTEFDELRHKGPLYFDIDCGEDLDKAANSTRQLVDLLIDYGVEERAIQVYASGSKGFHVMVPAKVFSTGRPIKSLPKIYARMARDLYVPGLDFSPYSGKKGNTFRIPNVQREKDGNYRVPLLLEEVYSVSSRNYEELVSEPRAQMSFVPNDSTLKKAIQLETLFNKHKEGVKNGPEAPAGKTVAEADLAQFQEEPPACIETIAAGDTKHSVSFNQIGMQFGAFVARSGSPKRVWQPMAARAADNTTSNSYDTPVKRREHLSAQVAYARFNKQMQFSCAAMRTVTGPSPCEGCPLYDEGNSNQDAGYELGIIEREDGYYLLGKEVDRKISNFTLVPSDECIEYGQAEGRWKRVGTKMDLLQNGEVLTTTMFDEHSWSSKSNFLKEVEGVKDLSFVGSDTDVQRIKTLVYREGREMGEIVRVYAAGIHAHKIFNRDVMVYVEPGYSVNGLKIQGTHEFQGTLQAPPNVRNIQLPKTPDETEQVEQAMLHLLDINKPHQVAQLAGWFASAHLRTHLQRDRSKFPILSIWGAAGSGKTSQATIMAQLSGADYMLEHSALNMSSVTPFALIDYCSTTTTVPRLLDEFNQTKMSKSKYDMATEIIKASWNQQTIARGKPGSGANGAGRVNAQTVAIPISSPLVIIGEQNPNVPAIQQRSVEVLISREQRQENAAAFAQANRMKEHLLPVAKGLVLESLQISFDWINEQLDRHSREVPDSMMERPQFSYAVLLTGLDFLERVCNNLGLGPEVALKISELRTSLVDHLEETAEAMAAAKAWSEVDNVLYDVGMMVAITMSETRNLVMVNKHLSTQEGKLLIDLPIVYALYYEYKKGHVVINNPKTMQDLLEQEDYFEGWVNVPAMVKGRKVAKLDLAAMETKGHTPSLFSVSM